MPAPRPPLGSFLCWPPLGSTEYQVPGSISPKSLLMGLLCCVLCSLCFFFFFRNFLRFDYKSGRRGRFYARLLHYFRALKTIKFSFEPSSFWLLGNPLNQTPAGVGVGVGYLVLVVIFVVDWVGLSLRRQVVPRYLFLHIFLNGVLLPWLLMRFSGSWTVASLTFFSFLIFSLFIYIFF